MIDIPKVQLLPIDTVNFDGKNPNRMTEKQYDALKKNIQKYGFLIPIITNANRTVADGEHRVRAAKDLGMNSVPTIVLNIEEVDRHIIRQVMNKLRGTHDYFMDAEEIKLIAETDKSLLASLLAIDEKEIEQFLYVQKIEDVPDSDIIGNVVDLRDVLIIQFKNSEHRDAIRGFFKLPPKKKSVSSEQIIDIIREKL